MKRTIPYLFILFAIFLLNTEVQSQNVIVNGGSNAGLISYLNANSITYSTNVTNRTSIASASHIFWVGSNSYAGRNNDLKNFVLNGGVLVISGDCNLSNNIAASQLLNMTFGFNVGFTNVSLTSPGNYCSANGTAIRGASCNVNAAKCSRLDYDTLSFPEITKGINSLTYNSAVNVAGIPGLISVRYKAASSVNLSNKLDIVSYLNYGNGVIIINGDASIFNTAANSKYFENIISYPSQDTIAPVVITKDITISVDSNGQAFLSPSQVDNGSTDNVGITTLGVSPSVFDCSNLGTNVVSLTATDAASNSASANATVTLVDSIMPRAIARSITVQLDSTGNATIMAADVDNGSSDNCSIASMSLDVNAFNCNDVGNPVQVTLTVADLNGNLSRAITTVFVSDANLNDADNDGIKDPCDLDDDNDGIPDVSDKYPLDSTNNGKAVILTYVWDDLNGDGIQDANEPPVSGTKVQMYGKFFRYLGETRTDSSGLAAFYDLNSNARVWLRYKRQRGHAFTYRRRGGNNQLDSDVGQFFGFSPMIRVNGTQVITNVDAGIWSPGTVEAYVWNDQNSDGLQDTNEVGVAGVEVRLLSWTNRTVDQVFTDSSGVARFKGVSAGAIRKLQFVAPSNLQITLQDVGTNPALDSDANPHNGKTSSFILRRGAALLTNIDAGLAPISTQLRFADENPELIAEEIPEEMKLLLYPNPMQSDFNLKISSPKQEGALIIVFDIMGNRVMEKNISLAQGENFFNFDFSSENLAVGQYILNIYPNSQEMKTVKFIKQ